MSVTTKLNKQGIIEQTWSGNQDASSVVIGLEQLNSAAIKAMTKKLPVLVLINVTKLGKTTAGARAAGARGMRTIPFKRVAMYGANAFNRNLINIIIVATGKSSVAKVLNSRSAAIKWLNHV